MAHGKPRAAHKERQWRRWIRDWRASGLTVRAFCARHGLTEPSFYAWRRVLLQRSTEAATFLPVQVVTEPVPPSASPLEVILAGGRTVRVAPGFDPATLREVVRVLEEGGPC